MIDYICLTFFNLFILCILCCSHCCCFCFCYLSLTFCSFYYFLSFSLPHPHVFSRPPPPVAGELHACDCADRECRWMTVWTLLTREPTRSCATSEEVGPQSTTQSITSQEAGQHCSSLWWYSPYMQTSTNRWTFLVQQLIVPTAWHLRWVECSMVDCACDIT